MTAKRIRWVVAVATVVAALTAGLVVWLTRDAETQQAAVLGEVLVSRDGRTLTTAVRWTPCQEAKPRLTARESSGSVTVALREGSADLRHQCASTPQLISTTLRSPLASRKLTDSGTGAAITPFRATRLAIPRYLPSGYRMTNNVYPDDAGQRPVPSPFERTAEQGPVWTRFYSTPSGLPTLSITQISGTGPRGSVPGKYVSGEKVSFGGHLAYLDERSSDDRSIIWSDGTETFIVNSANPRIAKAQLLQIASHLAG
ncbi:hypothetical protein ACIRVK_41310 [Streptomyces sp. NPDC101152]|uniref:hypothetical protein n=1 Tax=Streptomyces sp. NPDC101152 TaxID=3366116 RepID=UPI0037F99BFD